MSAFEKYPRGVSARPASHRTPLDPLETITLVHVGVLVIFGAWAFGGNAPWSRLLLSWWASLGVLLTLWSLQRAVARKEPFPRPLRWLWPLVAINLLVVASTFNPSFREVTNGSHLLYVPSPAHPDFPSTARPLRSLAQLWFFDGVYLTCFNLALIVRQRWALRALLLVLSINAAVLAIFGTAQKLIGAKGLYFGLQKSPQPFYFSTFVYHNHWGSFIVLMTAACLGLVFHFARRNDARDFWHSPAALGLLAILLMAASVPLSGSRSCSLLMLTLLSAGFLHWLFRLLRSRRAHRESVALPVALSLLALAAAGYFAYDIGRPMITHRLATTEAQLAKILEQGGLGQRATLYRDTWRMAQEKPWFGWGMASYPTAFYTFNSQQISKIDGLPTYYNDAHSDWLQSFAEHGYIGTALFALCGLVPLWYRRRALLQSPLAVYLLAGCALLVLYAWVEFPFGNGSVIIVFWVCFFCAVHYGRLQDPDQSVTSTPPSA